MKNLLNKILKGKKVYVVEMKCYSTTKELIEEHSILKREGLFLTNGLSVYHSEQEAKAAIETEINNIKNSPWNVDIEVNDDEIWRNRYNYKTTITYSTKVGDTIISSFKVEISLIEREII